MLVFSYRQNQQFYSTLAGLYPDGSEGRRNAFNKYVSACFPHQVRIQEQDHERVQRVLERMFKQGPMVIS